MCQNLINLRRVGFVVLAGLIFTSAAACSKLAAAVSESGEGPEGAEATAPVNPVPAGLQAVEGLSEAAYDHAIANGAIDVAKDATAIMEAWKAARPVVATAGAAADLLLVDKAIGKLSASTGADATAVTMARAANAIIEPMGRLYAVYNPKPPSELLDLDYLDREVVVDAVATDFAAATGHTDKIEVSWKLITAKVAAASGGQAKADAYVAHIADLRTATATKDAKLLQTKANAGLELVDAMEALLN